MKHLFYILFLYTLSFGQWQGFKTHNNFKRNVTQSTETIVYLFDNYPTDAAYSVRLLNSSYTGYAMTVRRSSDNAESDIGFVGGNLDTTTLKTFVGAGSGFVKVWYDQSGNNRNTSCVSTATQPMIVNAGAVVRINGQPAIKFDDSNDELQVLSFGGAATSDYYFVMDYNDDSNAMTMTERYATSAARFSYYCKSADIAGPIGQYGSPSCYVNGAVVDVSTRTKVYNEFSNGKAQILRIDQGANTSTWINHCFGLWFSGYSFGGYLQEWLVYQSDHSGSRTGIESNINTYYGIW